jgi:hypothetical protein
VSAAQEKATAAERSLEKLRTKVRTQDQLYLVMRGELEAKKDRLRTQQEELERLQAFKVAVIDPLPPSQVDAGVAKVTRADEAVADRVAVDVPPASQAASEAELNEAPDAQ